MTLVIKVDPIPGESLPGLICRAAATNRYERAFDVLDQAGLGELRPESVVIQDRSVAAQIAEVLGTDAAEVERMFYPKNQTRESVDFFGMALRNVYRESKVRRVSPRALRLSPHMRAIWQVRPFSFDPQTFEALLSHCPVCERKLGFSRTSGVVFCEFCSTTDARGFSKPTVDLRDFPQPLVEIEDAEALSFVTGLVDPDPQVRASFSPNLPGALRSMDRGQLFEMVLALAAAISVSTEPDYVVNEADVYRKGMKVFAPGHLEIAGRALLDWPAGFARLCEKQALDSAARPSKWGAIKELGALAILPRDAYVAPAVREAFTEGIELYFSTTSVQSGVPRNRKVRRGDEYVGANELILEMKVGRPVINRLAAHPAVKSVFRADAPFSPRLFLKWQVEPILQAYKDLIPETTLAFFLGTPLETMRDFAHSGYFKHAEGVEATLRTGEMCHSRAEFEHIFGFLIEEAPGGTPDPDDRWVSFADAMLMFPAGRKPWFALFEEIFQGRVHVRFHGDIKLGLVRALSVRGVEKQREMMKFTMRHLPAPNVDTVTIGDARLMLGITVYPVFTACVKAGMLSVTEKNAVPYADVMEFARRYSFTNEIAVRSHQPKGKLEAWLRDHRLLPVRDLGMKGGKIFDRAEVEPLLEMQ